MERVRVKHLMYAEFLKFLWMKKTFVFLGIFIVMWIGLSRLTRSELSNHHLQDQFNGIIYPIYTLNNLSDIFLPILIVLFAADSFGRDIYGKTIRLIVTRGFTRNKLLIAKVCALSLFIAIFLIITFIIGEIIGLISFKISINETILSLTSPFKVSLGSGLVRVLILYVLYFFASLLILSIVLFLSILIKRESLVILTSLGLLIGSSIMADKYPAVKMFMPAWILDYGSLLTSSNDISINNLLVVFVIIILYIIVFLGLTRSIFHKIEL